jgi:putative signal transducing protein
VRWPWRQSPSDRPIRGDPAVAGELTKTGELQLVKVAYANNLPEAELIQSLLRQEHIPSMVRRNGGFDVPDFIASGPRDVLVPASQADRARELLA